jgi:mitochondrial enoyl-[acyl-carrier protein] reductase / trans-2-enoyl-CoA reductase
MLRTSSACRHGLRLFSSAVKFSAVGDPLKVLQIETQDALGKINADEVHIKFLASPIHPSDINMVQGSYGVAAKLPAVGGNEGVAVVTEVGSNVRKLAVGDWVIPFRTGFGCWRNEAVTCEGDLIKVANDIPAAYAATLSVNPATAYRLLRDFAKLKPGDVIIQNGANSMVGLAVIQMAKSMGIKTINIIRSDRPRVKQLLELLSNLGGDVNVVNEQVNTPAFRESISKFPPCRLAFNCIGGSPTTEMIRCLETGGTVVTYGGMSRQPLTVPVDLLTYRQLNLRGFWMAAWYEERGPEEKAKMMEDIVEMIRSKQLSFFYDLHDFKDFHKALEKSFEPYGIQKIILDFSATPQMLDRSAKSEEIYRTYSN